MSRFLGSAECLSFIDLVISEAETDTGTWSLATYLKMRKVIPHFPGTDMALFVKRVVDLAAGPSTKPTTRYKLAQILSAVHALGLPEFERAVHEYHQTIEDSCEEINQSCDLGKPTVRLLKSLAVERGPRLTGGLSDFHLRRISATPVYSPSNPAIFLGARMCRSPDPAAVSGSPSVL
jgi:hypothetical protein